MNASSTVRHPSTDALAIAASALRYDDLSDLTLILKAIGEATHSFAVLLWALAPGVDPRDESKPGQLFVLADWIRSGNSFASHTLPLNSCTGIAILQNETIKCQNTETDRRVYKGPPDFFFRYKIKSFISTPLRLGDSEYGALNLYRADGVLISDAELAIAENVAQILPGIYAALREKSNLKLIGKVSTIIQKYEGHQNRLRHSTAQDALKEIAKAISQSFRCLESSIFLVQGDVEPNTAKLEATTFNPYIRRTRYQIGDPGLTGWILTHRAPLHIFDLQFYDRDRGIIESRYRGLKGFKLAQLITRTRAALKITQDPLQPLSFVGVPILVGKSVLGVIRCCTPHKAPYYYGERDENLLGLVASQVGHYWKNWLQLGAIQNENESWELLITSLNQLIRGASRQEQLDENTILKQFLHVAHNVVPGADIFDVRLFDPEKRELYFAATEGKAWDERRAEVTKRFAIDGKSAGAWVFNHKETRIMLDVSKDELYNKTFPNVKSMVIAPIGSGGEPYGVLDVRFTTSFGIPPNTPTVAEALGQQLGLYLHLSRTLRKAQKDREETLQTQTRVFHDLEHQLKLPIFQANSRLTDFLESNSSVSQDTQAIAGLLRKSVRVVRGMGVFVTLAKQQQLKTRRLTRLHKGPLVKLLIEICMDCTFLEGRNSRGLRFRVKEETFGILDLMPVHCDADLLEQAAYDIIDNACKYSFNFQRIDVNGGLNSDGRFYIAVINKGLDLLADDIPHITTRGWRGTGALLATGQGSGIGCWFAHQVMVAHGGSLTVIPTTPEKFTEVRLQF
jgi:signal transduction histidine kinase